MALRLVRKINRHLIPKNPIKFISEKSSVASPKCSEVEKTTAEENLSAPSPSKAEVFRYQVCRPKTTPVNRFTHKLTQDNADPFNQDFLKSGTESTPMFSTAASRFEISKTVQNSTLPLKMPRLACPYPDPVKVMTSHTISDQEKADMMHSEAKCNKVNSRRINMHNPNIHKRFFSSDSGNTANLDPSKCKKLDQKGGGKKSCPKMVAPGCIAPKKISCTRRPPLVECTKKEAPYPSYSETCHEDLEMKPSECRLCPWKPDQHPTFKPPKKKFHTSAYLFDLRKGECGRGPSLEKEPCGWIKHGKDECEEKAKTKAKTKGKKKGDDGKKKNKFAVPDLVLLGENATSNNGYLFDVRKPPCKQPPKVPCGKPKKKVKEVVNKKKKEEECPDMIDNVLKKEKEGKNPPKKASMSLAQDIDKWLTQEPITFENGMLLGKKKKNILGECKDKCKKLPFDNCPEKKPRVPIAQKVGGCPPKIKKKKIKDCPKSEDGKDCNSINLGVEPIFVLDGRPVLNTLELASDKDGDKKCPKVNLGICKDDTEDDGGDPCHKKKTGRTETCNPNLVSRYKNKKDKPKPKKKAAYAPLPSFKIKGTNSTFKRI